MEIVIDISDEVYKFIINRGHIPYAVNIANAIANGTPLPKGHGRLIDVDALPIENLGYCLGVSEGNIDRAPTIPLPDFKDGYKQAIIDGKTSFSRPTGEWLIIGEEQGALGVIYKIRKCSRCGWEHGLLIPDDYCPKCGADMKGKENER